MLNDFLNVSEYQVRINENQKRLLSEIRYVEDLLVAASDDHIDPPMQAKVNVHVAYIKEKRELEKKWSLKNFK